MTTELILHKLSAEEIRASLGIKEAELLSPILSEALFQICDDIEKYALSNDRIKFVPDVWCHVGTTDCQVCLAGIGMLSGRFGNYNVVASAQYKDQSFLQKPDAEIERWHAEQCIYESRCQAFDDIRAGAPFNLLASLTQWLSSLYVVLDYEKDASKRALLLSVQDSMQAYIERAGDGWRSPWSQNIREIYKRFNGWEDLPKLRSLAEHFKQNGF